MCPVEERRLEGDERSGGGGDRGRPVRVALAASHALSPVWLLSHLYGRLAKLPTGSVILLREPRKQERALFERNISLIAENLGYEVEWFAPDEGGRGATFRRDYDMVESADWVECFFSPDAAMEGGTGHIAEAALNREVPLYAWSVDGGKLLRIGEFDPEE